MSYELKREDVYGLAGKLNAETFTKGNELFFKYCPVCHGGGNDKNTFSVNLETGAYKCFRSSCGTQGHFVQLAKMFNYPLDFQDAKQKRYRQLPQREIVVRNNAIDYMAKRGISRGVCERYKITTRKDNDKIIAFLFYDDAGILQFIKYRTLDKRSKNKEWCETGTKPILFGMFQCVDFERLIITEGQIDSLSVAECEINNSVSVPTGALGFTWLEHCWEWVHKFKEVVVFGDFEKGKITLVDELSRRLLVPVKVVRQEDYFGEKDANDILQKYGKDAIAWAVNNAEFLPVNHIKKLSEVKAVDIYKMDRVKTNINEIDKLIGGFYFGQVVLLTGKRGEGKSTFMSQLIVDAIEQGYKTLAYSGELPDYHFKRWLDLQAAGPKNINSYKNEFNDDVYFLRNEVVEKINTWYDELAYIYDNDAIGEGEEYEALTETIEKAIRRYGIKFICIDNLMTALDVDAKDDLYHAQSKFLKKLKTLAVRYDVVVLLVAHPRKTNQALDNDDVSGSADITNRVDVVMSYERNKTDESDSSLAILKNRLTGRITTKETKIKLFYSNSTKRISSFSSNKKSYGWEKKPQFEEIDDTEQIELPFKED